MSNIRLPLQTKDLTGDIQTISGYVVALRVYPFSTNTIVGVEAEEAPGYYDYEDIQINVAYQLWYGTSLQTMERNKAFSDDDGKVILGIDDSSILDPADGDPDDLVCNNAAGDGIIFKPIATVLTDGGIDVTSVNYYTLRAIFEQDNSISSGKLRITFLPNAIDCTIADAHYLSASSKTGTGIYKNQFRTGGSTSAFNQLVAALTQTLYFRRWDSNRKFPVYHFVEGDEPELMGYFHFGTNIETGGFEYPTGLIESRTYAPDGVTLSDDILIYGSTFEIKAYAGIVSA